MKKQFLLTEIQCSYYHKKCFNLTFLHDFIEGFSDQFMVFLTDNVKTITASAEYG